MSVSWKHQYRLHLPLRGLLNTVGNIMGNTTATTTAKVRKHRSWAWIVQWFYRGSTDRYRLQVVNR